MKFFVSILGLALLYTVSSLPIIEQSTGGSAAPASADLKTDAKSELSSTTLAAEKITESAAKESSSPAPSSTSATEDRGASSPKEGLLPQTPLQQQPLKPSAPSPALPAEEPAKGHHHAEPLKPETDIKTAPLTAELAAKPDIKVEQVSSSEKPKELNNQVNAVSVDEPKPVQNEVKSEIPKEMLKSDAPKEEVKAEKLEEKKEEKREEHRPLPVLPVLGGLEAKPAEKPAEEIKKPATSSEEKSESHEKDDSKEADKKEPAKPNHSSESSEEKKPEKPVEGTKKEESSVKPQAEPLPTETAKPSTSAQPALEKLPEKLESEKDVIKREAAKDKTDEKKPIEKKTKITPTKEINNKKPE